MSNINFRKFRKTYRVNLFSVAVENYQVGYQAEWDGKVRGIFDIENEYVFDFLNFNDEKLGQLRTAFDAIPELPFQEAQFTDMDFTGEVTIGAAVGAAGLDETIKGKFEMEKVYKFTFENVKSMEIPTGPSRLFRSAVRKLANNKGKLPRRIGHIQFVRKLFYAEKVALTVHKKLMAQLKLPIPPADVAAGFERTKNKVITFENATNVPFAVEFQSLKDFITPR